MAKKETSINRQRKEGNAYMGYVINYFSKSDGKKVKRPYDPHHEMQHEFVAKGSGKLCKRYWDTSKEGLRTANAPWTISIKKEKNVR